MEKIFASDDHLYIFEELLPGGNLKEYIERERGNLSEVEVAVVVHHVLVALKALHEHDIAHRTLGLRSIRMSSLDTTARAVLTDFTTARKLSGQSALAAGREADMNAAGAIMAQLLSTVRTRRHPCGTDAVNRSQQLLGASVHAQNLVVRLSSTQGTTPLSAAEALEHPWFREHVARYVNLENLYQTSIASWRPSTATNCSISLIPGSSNNIAQLDCMMPSGAEGVSKRVYYGQERPVEPHCKPFYRNVAELASSDHSWKRKRSWDEAREKLAKANKSWQHCLLTQSTRATQIDQQDRHRVSPLSMNSPVMNEKRVKISPNPLAELQNLSLEQPPRFVRSRSFKRSDSGEEGFLLGGLSTDTTPRQSHRSDETASNLADATDTEMSSATAPLTSPSTGPSRHSRRTANFSRTRLRSSSREPSRSAARLSRRTGRCYDIDTADGDS